MATPVNSPPAGQNDLYLPLVRRSERSSTSPPALFESRPISSASDSPQGQTIHLP
ncbi:MAG: hypothetical protein R2911_05990 [Caldilineaceae bacterium]